MAEIEWDNSLSIGNAEIDAQHKGWIELINRIHRQITRHTRTEELQNIGFELIAAMKAYCIMHFKCEEQLMASTGYVDIERHKELHRSLFQRLELLEAELADDVHGVVTAIFKLMGHWLVDHIMNEDMKIGFAQLPAVGPLKSRTGSHSSVPAGTALRLGKE